MYHSVFQRNDLQPYGEVDAALANFISATDTVRDGLLGKSDLIEHVAAWRNLAERS